MLKVEIQDETITTSVRGQYTFYEQTGWVTLKDATGKDYPHPERFTIQHPTPPKDADVVPHKIGHYIISPSSLYKNRFGQLDLGRLILVSVNANAAKLVA